MFFHFIKLYKDFLFQKSGADLVTACENQDNQGALDLIKADANVNFQNKHGRTALMKACHRGETLIVQALLKAGAIVDIQDKYGRTALIWSCRNEKEQSVIELIKIGADLNAQDNEGRTALMDACASYHRNIINGDIVNSLIKAGTDLNTRDKYGGRTALMMVCSLSHKNHEYVANSLIKAGADLNVQDEYGDTALMHNFHKGRVFFRQPDGSPSLEQVNVLLKITNLLLLNGAKVFNLEKISKLLEEWKQPSITEKVLQKMVITNKIQTDPLDNPSESLKLFQTIFELNEEETLINFCHLLSLSTKYNNTDKARIIYKLHQEFAPGSKENILTLQQVFKLSPEELCEICINNLDIFNLNDFGLQEINPEGNLDIDLLFDPLKAQQMAFLHQVKTVLLSNQDLIITKLCDKIIQNKEMVLYYCWYKNNKATEYGIDIQHKIFNKVVKDALFENIIFIETMFNLPNLSEEIAKMLPDELIESVIEEHEKSHINLSVPEDILSLENLENNIEVEIIGDTHPSKL